MALDAVKPLTPDRLADLARYRGGSRAGWTKVKDASWYKREAWRFERR